MSIISQFLKSDWTQHEEERLFQVCIRWWCPAEGCRRGYIYEPWEMGTKSILKGVFCAKVWRVEKEWSWSQHRLAEDEDSDADGQTGARLSTALGAVLKSLDLIPGTMRSHQRLHEQAELSQSSIHLSEMVILFELQRENVGGISPAWNYLFRRKKKA